MKKVILFISFTFFLCCKFDFRESIKNYKGSIIKEKSDSFEKVKWYTLESYNNFNKRYIINKVFVFDSDFYYNEGDTIK